MNHTYVQSASSDQKATTSAASSFLDASSQGEALQRKADLVNNAAQRAENPRPNNGGVLQFALGDGLDEDDVEIVEVEPEPKSGKRNAPFDSSKRCRIMYLENGEEGDHHIARDADLAERRRAKTRNVVKTGLSDCDCRFIPEKDDIVIISHGTRLDGKTSNLFANQEADDLAYRIFCRINPGRGKCTYQGEIFLDGCYTGEPLKKLHDGTSYAERFGETLKKLIVKANAGMPNADEESESSSSSRGKKSFTVKGNLGAVMTDSDGYELVELDRRNKRFFRKNADYLKRSKPAMKAVKMKTGLSYPGSIGKVKYKFEY